MFVFVFAGFVVMIGAEIPPPPPSHCHSSPLPVQLGPPLAASALLVSTVVLVENHLLRTILALQSSFHLCPIPLAAVVVAALIIDFDTIDGDGDDDVDEGIDRVAVGSVGSGWSMRLLPPVHDEQSHRTLLAHRNIQMPQAL